MSSLTVLSRAPELHTTYRSRSVVRPCCSGEAGTASPVLERREALAAALLAPLLLPTVSPFPARLANVAALALLL